MFYLFNTIKHKEIMDYYNIAVMNDNDKESFISALISVSLDLGFRGNLWKDYIIYTLIFNDNYYTRAIERNKNATVLDLVKADLKEYYRLYCAKHSFLKSVSNFEFNGRTTVCSKAVHTLVESIGNTYESFEKAIMNFYINKGLANMSLYKAFRVDDGKLSPIYNVDDDIKFDDLIGYDAQKKMLIDNTLNFISGKPANNVLLYGDSGTGKSTSIKALLNMFFDKGLRIIEIYKHQMQEISKIINTLRNRPYYYVIYMDDLSFEEDEGEYKYLKSIIEGGIEPKPENVLIYATSNRRHLIKENFDDNVDLHRRETEAEKLSLAYRFGLQIYYSSLSPKEFKEMVLELAKKNNLKVDENILLEEANIWQMNFGALSGRCATQFIKYMVDKYNG